MTNSLGESPLVIGSTHSGRVRLKGVEAEAALGPVLFFVLGFQLHDKPLNGDPQDEARRYLLTDLDGDVRLGQQGPFLGTLSWSGGRNSIRSSHYGQESDLRMTCQIDWHRLEALERYRAGKRLELWMTLWPRLELEGWLVFDATISPFRCDVPLESWVSILDKLRGEHTEILEVRIPPFAAGEFEAAMAKLRDARRYVDRGDYPAAIVACRQASETIAIIARGKDKTADGVREILIPLVGKERAKSYSQVLGAAKMLGNVELHTDVEHGYSRSEALFAIRTLESLVELLGDILSGTGNA